VAPLGDAFIQLIEGIGGSGEHLFGSSDSFRQERATLSQHLFPPDMGDQGRAVFSVAKTGVGRRLWRRLLAEVIQVPAQAAFRSRRGQERALFQAGLVPSTDRFHWAVCESHLTPTMMEFAGRFSG
jgi:hypothetical protein